MFTLFVFKQKTAYEMRISDWSSDVCSSDLSAQRLAGRDGGLSNFAEHSAERCDIGAAHVDRLPGFSHDFDQPFSVRVRTRYPHVPVARRPVDQPGTNRVNMLYAAEIERSDVVRQCRQAIRQDRKSTTSELQSLMRISYAVFCLKKKKKTKPHCKEHNHI